MITADRVTIGLNVGTQPPIHRIRLLTAAARMLGYDAAWTVDHFMGWVPQALWNRELSFLADPADSPHAFFDYQAILGYLARRAGRMQVAVGVTEAVRRHPVLLAQTAMTVSHLSRQPPILGIGAGEAENIVPYGLDFDRPVARLEEALQIIRLCFESRGTFDFTGRHFRLDRAVMDLAPARGRTPQLWIAAHGPRMLRLTGRYGDGWWPTLPHTPQTYSDALATIRRAAFEVGRDAGAIVPGWSAVAVLGRSEAEARRLLDSRAVRFAALLAPATVWRSVGVQHPFGDDFRGYVDFVPQRHDTAEIEAALAAVTIDVVAGRALWGTPETVYRRLRELVEAGLRHVMLAPVSALVSRRDALFSAKAMVAVLRRLRREGV